KARHSKAR
ncbi:hypothetical protein CP10139811_1463, partial [Chlamydia ibidis]